MKRTISAILSLLTTAGLSSCSDPTYTRTADETGPPSILHFDFGQPIGMTRAKYVDYLEQKAHELAKTDMARLSAVERIYRDKMYFYRYQNPGAAVSHGAYAKMYRQFTGYELIDITRSDSLFRPILFTIEFKCDILVSEPVFVDAEGQADAQTAHINNIYHFHRGDKIRRIYACDEKGSPQEPLPPPLERPNYWGSESNPFEVFSMKEVTGLP